MFEKFIIVSNSLYNGLTLGCRILFCCSNHPMRTIEVGLMGFSGERRTYAKQDMMFETHLFFS
jgi:hypothetical protein